MKINRFEDLAIWKESLTITRNIYDLLAKKEFNLEFELKNQIKRATISISSNIVEGFEKNNNNEFIRFLKISKGSVGEVRSQIYISFEIKRITQNEFDYINEALISLSNKIRSLINYLENQRKQGHFKPVNPLTR
ncbi:MAG: S23 ribosomal protein, nonfunctional [Candidatus Roizmanbacteria bacterium GW2011_GWA2_33_33]|uniref:S23 ribosomal protein, nonfunctional n=2 Tax=Candidatus Roizmaniibacteriota TaxID=1752723 RepID=A0A0G0AVA4_9BACT|nr:MAG: S23 ribosomal protein, nonfunctional [Candidatus Roizmanbacteria bacterium GW2011_GWA2_33_33]KKP61004.1 MAG: S23 ribosomal protein, nonfunctional [Candidatus Roizmanbacteria bacterium GW2011_GWC2_34_23]